MHDIKSLINDISLFENITEQDVEEIAKQTFPILENKIENTASFLSRTLLAKPSKQSKEAFEEETKIFIKNAVHSYIANKKWQSDVPFIPYITKAILINVKKFLSNNSGLKKTIKEFVCPACKDRSNIEEIANCDGVLYCKTCQAESLNSSNTNERILFYKTFAKHSLDGVKCPSCNKFVPNSALTDSILCPYPDCKQEINNADKMLHPSIGRDKIFISLNNQIVKSYELFNSSKQKQFIDLYCDNKENQCDSIIGAEDFTNRLSIIREIIVLQKKVNGYSRKTPHKATMYDAFLKVLDKFPEDMINYLTYGGQNSDMPIQALIYQEFANDMLQKLPFKYFQGNDLVYIDQPTDPRFHLFTGIKEFANFIDSSSVLRKRNGYSYDGDNKTIDNNESFIGKIISATTIDGKDVSQYIDFYNFTYIRFKYDEITKPGTDVLIKYYSLAPNYTIGSMTHLQRIKKKISDSINKRNND